MPASAPGPVGVDEHLAEILAGITLLAPDAQPLLEAFSHFVADVAARRQPEAALRGPSP